MEIIKEPNDLLREKSVSVKIPLSKEDRDLLTEMSRYLKASQDPANGVKAGVGLAAPQVGVLKKLIVIRYHNSDGKLVHYQLANPVIIKRSSEKYYHTEGCLSVDTTEYDESNIERYKSITVSAFDALTNKAVVLNVSNYDAAVLQHEIDHLDGILFYDRIKEEK